MARDEAKRAAEGLDETQLSTRRSNLIQKRRRMGEQRFELVQEVARLGENAKTLGGEGPAARFEAAEEAAQAGAATLARLQEEAAVLSLLDDVIREAQSEATRRYLAPITNRVAPYVSRLLPSASLQLGEDFAPGLLIRGDRHEDANHLSKGTQEQLAVLTRVAFADLLLEKGRPASLVLDDALVFADDDRFETMLEILSEVSKRLQVIILSCHSRAYRSWTMVWIVS